MNSPADRLKKNGIMTELIPQLLWVGVVHESRDLRRLYELGIEAVVDFAASEHPATLGRDMVYVRIPISDGIGNSRELLKLCVLAVEQLLRDGRPTLVVCGASLSRSPAIAAVAWARWQQTAPESILKDVAQRHQCNISPGLWSELLNAMKQSS